jgi:transposase
MRSSTAYPTDLTDAEWEILAPLIPPARAGGRPRRQNMRAIVNAMLYVLRGGIAWRLLPHDLPKWKTVYDYFWKWRRAGTWEEMCVQRRLAYSVGVQSHLGKSQSPVAWIAGRKETEFLKPIDKAISRMVSKSPGRNVSEPIGGLENRIRRSSLHFLGEDSMDRRN